MVRLLTAVLLFASFHVVAEVSLTDINNNEVADADEVMGNFNALKQGVEANATAIDALPTPPINCTADQIIKWDDTANAWVCATDPFAGLDCSYGDVLKVGIDGWRCSPLVVNLFSNYFMPNVEQSVNDAFGEVGVVSGYCAPNDNAGCEISVRGIEDHTECDVTVHGPITAELGASVSVEKEETGFTVYDLGTWLPGGIYIDISCP
jgi:hypothetical protein